MQRKWKDIVPPMVIVTGAVLGVLGALLVKLGNPPNMGLCIACFQRDIVGALGLHRAAVVQQIRPEIPGLVLGVMIAALFGKEFRSRSAPAPALSFLMGAIVMIGALVFLGCPIRMVLRLAGGDLNALIGLAGFAGGIVAGTFLLKRGFSLGRSTRVGFLPACVLPLLAIGLLVLVFVRPSFLFFSTSGPGSMVAPILVSLGAGLLVGLLAQRSRLCFAGGIRDVILIRSPHLLTGVLAALLTAGIANLILGQWKFGLAGQPIAHTVFVWNFFGMALVGLGSVLLGGCPFRQLVLASQGDGAALCAVLGLLAGAAFAHNFGLAASPAGVPVAGKVAVVAGLVFCLVIGWSVREA